MIALGQFLKSIYYSPRNPGGLASADKLYHAARKLDKSITHAQVNEWLQTQKTYALHKRPPIRFQRRKTILFGKDHYWQMDLMDVQTDAEANDMVRFLMVILDCWTKYVWLIPMHNKEAATTVKTLKLLFDKLTSRRPLVLLSDKGREFTASSVLRLTKKYHIRQAFTQNEETKATMVEACIKTLRARIGRYKTSRQTTRYLDVLPELVYAYNNSVHSATGLRPAAVGAGHHRQIAAKIGGLLKPTNDVAKKKTLFKIGDRVLITTSRDKFHHGYLPQYQDEVFTINSTITHVPPVYTLKDRNGEILIGKAYGEELEPAYARGIDGLYVSDDDEQDDEPEMSTQNAR